MLLRTARFERTAPMDLSDPETFQRVFAEHERSVYATAFRVLGNGAQAQDVVQDVFMRIWRRPRTFAAGRGELGSYLRLIARSRALDLWREAQAAGRAGDRMKLVIADAVVPVDGHPDHLAEQSSDRRTIRDALRALPDSQREAIVLAYWG